MRYFEKRAAKKEPGPERDPENENDVFPLTDSRVAVAINRINAGLWAAARNGRAVRCVATRHVAAEVEEAGRTERKTEIDRDQQDPRTQEAPLPFRIQF